MMSIIQRIHLKNTTEFEKFMHDKYEKSLKKDIKSLFNLTATHGNPNPKKTFYRSSFSLHIMQLFMKDQRYLKSPKYLNYEENKNVDVFVPAVIYVPHCCLIAIVFPQRTTMCM